MFICRTPLKTGGKSRRKEQRHRDQLCSKDVPFSPFIFFKANLLSTNAVWNKKDAK